MTHIAKPQININYMSVSISQSSCANPQQSAQALQTLQRLFASDQILKCGTQAQLPGQPRAGDVIPSGSIGGCIPQPQIRHCGAPAGKGLTKDPEGFPAGSVRTAGGYTIVPEGKSAAWSIFAPGQKATDKPHTRVWGDPHVDEKDGTRWDFTKNSDFVLPDGTRINCQTTSETGQSVSKGLTIANGMDRVDITGINSDKPTTSAVTPDGYQWRAKHLASNPNRDAFHLGGNDKDVSWFRERNNRIDGLITGAKLDAKVNGYEQTVDNGKQYWVDPNLRAPVGSPAWGNQLRAHFADQQAKSGLPAQYAEAFGNFMAQDHMRDMMQPLPYQPFIPPMMGQLPTQTEQPGLIAQPRADFGNAAFGGLHGTMNFQQAQMLLAALGQLLLMQNMLQSSLTPGFGRPIFG